MKIPFSLIVAVDSQNGIGKNGRLPWHLPADLKHFKEITSAVHDPKRQNVVVMGRKTWDSIPEKFRPLSGRINLVLSRRTDLRLPSDVLTAGSFDEALNILDLKELRNKWESLFVIGGAEIFREAIRRPECEKLFVTHVNSAFSCDTTFPEFKERFRPVSQSSVLREGDITFFFVDYVANK